jgi:hypothetical protein
VRVKGKQPKIMMWAREKKEHGRKWRTWSIEKMEKNKNVHH